MRRSNVTAAPGMIASVSLFVACASSPPPADRMASTEASVQAARDLGADRVPSAEAELRLAMDEIQRARELAKNDENDLADSMLQRAAADAELAIALATEDNVRNEAQHALDESRLRGPARGDTAPKNPELEEPGPPIPERPSDGPRHPELENPMSPNPALPAPGIRSPGTQ